MSFNPHIEELLDPWQFFSKLRPGKMEKDFTEVGIAPVINPMKRVRK